MAEFRFVFIGGCPRSGTTFLGQQIAQASGLGFTPESQFKDILFQKAAPTGQIPVEEARRCLSRNWRIRLWDVTLEEVLPKASPTQTIPLSELLQRLVIVHLKDTELPGWVDHTPNNLFFAREALAMLPNVKFIHIVRDPRAVFASVKNLDWGPSTPLAAANFWLRHVACGLAAGQMLPSKVEFVRYEDLIENPQDGVETILQRFELQSHTTPTEHQRELSVPAYTLTQHRLVGALPDPSRIRAWENTLSEREIELIEAQCMPVMKLLGYDTKHGPAPSVATLGERIKLFALEEWRRLRNRKKYENRVARFAKGQ